MKGNVLGQSSGGSKINGLIEEYQVADGEEIKAGDFVEYEYETDTKTKIARNEIPQIKISENKYLNIEGKQENSSYNLYGTIVTIEGDTITAGTKTKIFSGTGSIKRFSGTLVDEKRLLITYISSTYLYGIIVTTEGDTITVDTTAKISHNNIDSGNTYLLNQVKLNKNKVLLLFSTNASNIDNLYGTIVTIEGDTITASTEVNTGIIKKDFSLLTGNDLLQLKDNKILIISSNSTGVNNCNLYGTIVTTEGDTITVGTSAIIDTGNSRYYFSPTLIQLNENKILIVFLTIKVSDDYKTIYHGTIVTIEGDTITVGTKTKIPCVESDYSKYSLKQINKNKFLIMFKVGGNIITVNKNKIVKGSYYKIIDDGTIYSSEQINKNKILITYTKEDGIYEKIIAIKGNMIILLNSLNETKCIAIKPGTIITKKAKQNKFFVIYYSSDVSTYYVNILNIYIKMANELIIGIAKTSGKSGDTIKVIVPNYEEEEGE